MLQIEVFANYFQQLRNGGFGDPLINPTYWGAKSGPVFNSAFEAGKNMRSAPKPESIEVCALSENCGALVALRPGFAFAIHGLGVRGLPETPIGR